MTNRKHLDKIVDRAVDASFKKGKMDPQAVKRLTKSFKDMNLIESIYTLSKYAKRLKRILAQQTMVIESVIPVSALQVNKIKNNISRLFTVADTQVTINPYILGGLKIRVGDTVLDYSVRNKLNQVTETILNG